MEWLVEVETLPTCDIHMAYQMKMVTAHYDGKTVAGTWAYMCEDCFNRYGLGLGTGLGQVLYVKEEATK